MLAALIVAIWMGLHRGDAVCHGADDVVDVPLLADVRKVLIVRAEGHMPRGQMIFRDLPDDVLYAAACRAKAQMDMQPAAELSTSS